jgi:N-acetylmuramoyl-L-alanine amidase
MLHRNQPAMAARMSRAVAQAGGFIDRGAKVRTNLGFLNLAQRPAILTEICFVNSTVDVELYRRNFEPICKAAVGQCCARLARSGPRWRTAPRLRRCGIR